MTTKLSKKKKVEKAIEKLNRHTSLSRPIIATVYNRKKEVVKRYFFARPKTAIPRCTFYAMDLEPGFVIEFTHALNGFWIGHIKVKTNRKFETNFVWDENDK